MEKETFILKSLGISIVEYGNDKGKYRGRITFVGNKQTEFGLQIKPEDIQKFINLIKGQIIESANDLANKLQISLELKDEKQSNLLTN